MEALTVPDGPVPDATAALFLRVKAVANAMGLELRWLEGRKWTTVTVLRDAQDWSMGETRIAGGRDPRVVADAALAALRTLAPQIQKQIAEDRPEEPIENLTLAAGVGSDGSVTTLRVERDGSVRLSPEDIEAIAKAVSHLIDSRNADWH